MFENITDNYKFNFLTRKSVISNLLKNYNFISYGIIGKSLCNRPIEYLSIGNKNNCNLWVSAHHGSEYITSMIVLNFLDNICEKIKQNQKLYGIDLKEQFNKQGLVIVPCLNPDGVDIQLMGPNSAGKYSNLVSKIISENHAEIWQANAHGVDLNHNYNAGWEKLHILEQKNNITGPSYKRYGGTHFHSEPETISLVNFCEKNNFNSATAFHSQGEEIYWDYGKNTPKISRNITNILAISSKYTINSPEQLATGGGFKDWFITRFKKPGFTIEVGLGKNPLPITNFENIYTKIEPMLYINSIYDFN